MDAGIHRPAFERADYQQQIRLIPRRTILYGPPAAYHVNQQDDDRDHQQNVDKAAYRIRTDHPEQPENEQYDENGPKHRIFPPERNAAIQSPSHERA